MRSSILGLILFALLPTLAFSQPMTAKDLALMVRMGVPENEIFQELQKRRLDQPIDRAAEATLKESGATEILLSKLKAGEYVMTPEEVMQAAEQRNLQLAAVSAREQKESANAEARKKEVMAVTQNTLARDTMLGLLDGRIVKVQSMDVRPYSTDNFRNVRVYAFYYSAAWCPACRELMPSLLAWYQKMKANYPEFELIWVSDDKSEISMTDHMRKIPMPWPAVRFDLVDEKIKQYAGSSIPWLVAVSDTGKPLTKNGHDKQYMQPGEVMGAIEYILGEMRGGRMH